MAPTAEAWLSVVVPPAAPRDDVAGRVEARGSARALLPSAVNDAVPLTDGPGVIGMSSQVAPSSVEYCSLVTPTSSVAVTLSTVGAVCVNHPLLPVDVDGAAGGLPLRCGAAVGVNVPTLSTGAVVSVPWPTPMERRRARLQPRPPSRACDAPSLPS